jgi:hypothetical protein
MLDHIEKRIGITTGNGKAGDKPKVEDTKRG